MVGSEDFDISERETRKKREERPQNLVCVCSDSDMTYEPIN